MRLKTRMPTGFVGFAPSVRLANLAIKHIFNDLWASWKKTNPKCKVDCKLGNSSTTGH